MYKQMIPADFLAREVQWRAPTYKLNKPVPNRETSAAQMAEAEAKCIAAHQWELAAEEQRCVRFAAGDEDSIVTINNANIYDPCETEIACSR